MSKPQGFRPTKLRYEGSPQAVGHLEAIELITSERIIYVMDERPMMSEHELMWRCLVCGHMWPNKDDALPDKCHHCDAPKTEFELVRED